MGIFFGKKISKKKLFWGFGHEKPALKEECLYYLAECEEEYCFKFFEHCTTQLFSL